MKKLMLGAVVIGAAFALSHFAHRPAVVPVMAGNAFTAAAAMQLQR